MERILNNLAEEVLGNAIESAKPYLIYESPTSYGKTSSTFRFYKLLESRGEVYSHIHVLPMRSITYELYCKTLKSIRGEVEECKGIQRDNYISKHVNGLSEEDIGYQSMDLIDEGKSPFFLRRVIITTFNSFFHNLTRVSIGEIMKRQRHFETPRLSIFTSSVVLDEAHLYGEESNDDKSMFTAFLAAIKILSNSKVPFIIESATIPDSLRVKIMEELNSKVSIVRFVYKKSKCDEKLNEVKSKREVNYVECYDEEFSKKCLDSKWETKLISENQLVKDARESIDKGEKVLIVRNTVKDAVETYKKLKELNCEVLLIHGRFKESDKVRRIKEIEEKAEGKRPLIVVATQIIEAGVNINMDVLITDKASPSSLIQRAGRINRGIEGGKTGEVYVIEDVEQKIYDRESSECFVNLMKEVIEGGRKIDWRLPSYEDIEVNGEKRASFLKLLNECYKEDFKVNYEIYENIIEVSKPIKPERGKIEELLRENVIYGTVLIPLYFGKEPESLRDVMNDSVQVSLDFLKGRQGEIVKREKGKVKIVIIDKERYENADWTLRVEELDEEEFKKLINVKGGHKIPLPLGRLNSNVVAIYGNKYEEEVGLV